MRAWARARSSESACSRMASRTEALTSGGAALRRRLIWRTRWPCISRCSRIMVPLRESVAGQDIDGHGQQHGRVALASELGEPLAGERVGQGLVRAEAPL